MPSPPRPRARPLLIALAWMLCALRLAAASAEPRVSVAAAANLLYALDAVHGEFRRVAPEIALTTTIGASGNLFAQLKHGAPFDVFLSADTDYPRHAVEARIADPATLRVFATGRLVVWTTRRDVPLGDLASLLRSPAVRKIAIAQPASAPYGRAAQAVLEQLGATDAVRTKLVLGESISQTAQFVETGNADIGFIALSLVRSPRLAQRGVWREVPAPLYASVSLDHTAVLTLRGAANPAAQRYLEFLGSAAAQRILRDFGYAVPPAGTTAAPREGRADSGNPR